MTLIVFMVGCFFSFAAGFAVCWMIVRKAAILPW
jgi:hypothetical protein